MHLLLCCARQAVMHSEGKVHYNSSGDDAQVSNATTCTCCDSVYAARYIRNLSCKINELRAC